MKISKLISTIPTSIKVDIIDFTDVRLKNGKNAVRITIDRLLTDSEILQLKSKKNVIGADCVCSYRYAPEIKKSYFYVV